MKNKTLIRSFLTLAVLLLSSIPAMASYDVNIPPPATPVSEQIFGLHMYILWICVVIFVIVFGAMFYSIFKFRKSKGATADVNFHESTLIEVIWTIIPFIILIAIAVPAAKAVLDMKDTSNPDVTIKVTAFQWGWRYDYSADDFGFYSNLKTPWSQIGQPGVEPTQDKHANPDYLLEVDNELVVPVNKRVRLLVTSADVIHGWYVPQLGVNQYGIPGFIKDAWFKATRVGVFKGQCSQICGKLHGYMPITVRVVSESDYGAWLADAKTKWAAKSAAAPAAPVEDSDKKYTMDELKSMGEKVYSANCAACHQPNGKGMPPAFPPLAGSKVVTAAAAKQLEVVLNGRTGTAMQPFARLSNTDLAAVITYTKNAFGNSTGQLVQPADVKAARK